MIIKKGFAVVLLTVSAVSFVGCQSNDVNINGVVDNLTAVDDLAAKEMEIQNKLDNGEISKNAADKMLNDVEAEYSEKSENMIASSTSFSGLPDWAKKIGLSEAKGLTLNEKTAHADQYSLNLEYSGDYEVAAAEGRRIGAEVGLKENTSNRAMLENLLKMSGSSMPAKDKADLENQIKQIMLSNAFSNDPTKLVTITVTPEGLLTIVASSEAAIKKAMR